jgi:hypothetical protein
MDAELKEAFQKVIPNYLQNFKNNELLTNNFIARIKKKIKRELVNPNVSIFKKDIAKFLLISHIEEGLIKNKQDFNDFYSNFEFVSENLEKFEFEALSDSFFGIDNDLIEDTLIYNDIIIQNYYLKDDPDWFIQIGLRENPFPSQDGLFLISKKDYDNVVLKTLIYNKYMEILENDPIWILNKSIVIYGDFGCGKTTFFDYIGYKILLNNILPIRIILNAKPTLSSLHHDFNQSLFNELADFVSKYSEDPRGNITAINNYNIFMLFKKIQSDRNLRGFVIFLDGLHKSQDQQDTALNFLIELQNILEFYRRKDIALSIFIAGSIEWQDKINTSKKFSGSVFSLEKMEALNVNQAYEMLTRRFTVFSKNKEKHYIKFNEIQMLVTLIERALASDINFRILIKNFLQNGFIFKNRIKIKPFIEDDVLNNILEAIKSNKKLYNTLLRIKNEYQNQKSDLVAILKVISTTYDMGYFFEDHNFYQKYSQFFKYLYDKDLVVKSEKYKKDNSKPFSLNQLIQNTFKDIENKVKLHPTHYLELLFMKTPKKPKSKAEYLNILDTAKRYKQNNPEIESKIENLINFTENTYFVLINAIENTLNFHISHISVRKMNNTIEVLLRFLYDLSEEQFPVNTQTQIFNIFRYTWLDNQVLTQYFNWSEGWNPNINNKNANIQFLKQFIDTYESLIYKIGKHILYNKILIVGSKDLNNNEKIKLNSARAFFSEKQFKKSIEVCHDLIERTLREFIFNILFIKYGSSWESLLPKKTLSFIKNIKLKEKKQYGELLSDSSNSLYYLSRSAYSIIIDDDYLWSNCFSMLFGSVYRSFIKETLENLANLGHLDKHNRDEQEISKISPIIQQNLKNSKQIIEKINKSYLNLVNLNSIIIKGSEIIPRFNPTEKTDKIQPISFDDINFEELLEKLNDIDKKGEIIFKKLHKISSINQIQDAYSISYRKFLGSILYLLSNKSIEIRDYYGSSIMFRCHN